ncbi:MAG: hypothetical protein V4660_11910 [Pseudomonadota bacterium]
MFNFSDQLQELRALIIGLVLLLATTIIGLIWISIGFYHGISIYLGPTWGPIVLGVIFFVPMLIFTFVKAFSRNTQQARQQSGPNPDTAVLNFSKVIESLSGQSPFVVASIAIIGGVLASRFPALLSIFMQVITAYSEDAKIRSTKNTASSKENIDAESQT